MFFGQKIHRLSKVDITLKTKNGGFTDVEFKLALSGHNNGKIQFQFITVFFHKPDALKNHGIFRYVVFEFTRIFYGNGISLFICCQKLSLAVIYFSSGALYCLYFLFLKCGLFIVSLSLDDLKVKHPADEKTE